MRVGRLLSMPDAYTRFARIKDEDGTGYTVDPSQLPDDASVDREYAYKVEIWENDSGIAFNLEDP